ncbi:HtaA domain-containing protein [Streptomyces sp. AN091965]|uniref:HtaA domain-containing protein n=1 Tax=Streptomyces sp. AN091965 TaxID=2927803 RepID=UPI001F619A58|nr:HtaA domain-containing protein [Streptomyces sp. AN091965]MCI3930310.1 HtaA domain-containing protein [Streptomyces sp. AN091965]
MPLSRPPHPPRAHSARAVVVAVLAGLVTALLPAAAAHAEERTVRGGRLDWGLKSSFQSYVTGPVAHGSWNLRGGAATVGGSQFRFHSAQGSYDPASGAFSAAFSGGVHFTGHQKGSSYQLDLTVSRPTVKVSGGSGTLYADMVSKAKGTGKVTSTAQVPLASLNLSGIDMKGGSGPIALTNIPATLTVQGAKAFAGYYTAGTRLDPVSLSTDLAATGEKPADKPSKKPGDSGGKGGKKDAKGTKAKAAGRIEDAAVDWGVRRTFREYVSGSIAQGTWTLSSGAQDGGALFRFPRGEGSYDEKKRTLDADFTGAVRFTGKHGLDIRLSRVAVGVEDGEGTLYADVDSGDFTKKKAPLVTFTGKGLADLKPKDGLVAVTEAPAKLTADGARAFGSLYKAGTAMDPVSLAVAVDEKAELPALPDLGSAPEPKAAKAPASGPKAEKAARSADDTSDSSPALPITIGAVAALLVAAAVVFGVTRKRRTARATGTADDTTGTS